MRFCILRCCALTFISVLGLSCLSAHEYLQGQSFAPAGHSSQTRGTRGKTRKANADTPTDYSYAVLYNFCSEANCADGGQIQSGLVRDAAGNLYGVTQSGGSANYGTVFKLDTAGNETVLYNFCSLPNCADGVGPNSLIIDSVGNLYGTAFGGGANMVGESVSAGVVFELSPPAQAGGAWTETALYNFCSANHCSDGFNPFFGIVQDTAGNIYGTTLWGCVDNGDGTCSDSPGTIFELSPPSQPGGAWTETVLHAFFGVDGSVVGAAPSGSLIQDAAGNLYGTTVGGGTGSNTNGMNGIVFRLSPPLQPGGAWTETVLYNFCSLANCADGGDAEGVIMNTAGNLFGVTQNAGLYYDPGSNNGGGTVFELTPPAQPGDPWTETVLYSFCSLANCADGQHPTAAPTQDAAGNLYGITDRGGANQAGVLFELSPPPQPGGSWAETVLYSFCMDGGTNCTDGQQPRAGLTRDSVGNLYGTTRAGGSRGGGTVFTLAGSFAVPTFTITGTSVSVGPGATASNTSTITLNPNRGFVGGVTLAAAITSSPNGAQAIPSLSFGASNIVSLTDSSPATATLTITTTAPTSAVLEHSARPGIRCYTSGMMLALGLIFGIGICIPMCGGGRRARLGPLFLLVMLASGLLSCSSGSGGGSSGTSNPGTTPGIYVVTVIGNSGITTATGTVTVTVQ